MEAENTAPGRERRPVAPPIGDPERVRQPGRGQRVQDGRGRGLGRLRAALPGAGGPGDGGADRDPDGLGGGGAAPLLWRGGGGGPVGDVVVDAEVPGLDVDAANIDVVQLPLERELGRRGGGAAGRPGALRRAARGGGAQQWRMKCGRAFWARPLADLGLGPLPRAQIQGPQQRFFIFF